MIEPVTRSHCRGFRLGGICHFCWSCAVFETAAGVGSRVGSQQCGGGQQAQKASDDKQIARFHDGRFYAC